MLGIITFSKTFDFKDYINQDSLQIIQNALAEPALKTDDPNVAFQFIRKGYFVVDRDSTKDQLVFNRTVSLKDGWAKEAKKA